MKILAGLIGIFLLFWVLQSGILFQTGYQWHQACWLAQNSGNRSPQTAEEATAWAQCAPVARRALFEAGYLFSGNPEYAVTPALKALTQACPSSYSEIPVGGVHLLVVKMLQNAGGPNLLDRFMPVDSMIVRTFNSRWPDCNLERTRNGFPRIVMKNREWGWETPCKTCEPEITASEKKYP